MLVSTQGRLLENEKWTDKSTQTSDWTVCSRAGHNREPGWPDSEIIVFNIRFRCEYTRTIVSSRIVLSRMSTKLSTYADTFPHPNPTSSKAKRKRRCGRTHRSRKYRYTRRYQSRKDPPQLPTWIIFILRSIMRCHGRRSFLFWL